jgi:hypothetical protein
LSTNIGRFRGRSGVGDQIRIGAFFKAADAE